MSDCTAAAEPEVGPGAPPPGAPLRPGGERIFRTLLLNTLVTGVTSSFVWFALTFWVYLETRSVVATGVIGGGFSISSALLGPAYGTFVDRHRKHVAMVAATAISAGCFAAATLLFLAVDAGDLLRLRSPWFWLFVALTLLTDGRGADWIGGWFGTGPERGIALVFTASGLIGITVTLVARASGAYRRLLEATPPLEDAA